MQMTERKYYQGRITKTLEYLYNNLDAEINIEHLAKLSHFSIYHFQRVFKALTSESPYDSLLRLRLEKSLFFLKNKPEYKIHQIAFESGFPSPENFSRQFKTRFKISPSHFRKNRALHNSRIYQDNNPNDLYALAENLYNKQQNKFEVTLECLPEIPIVFTRAIYGKDGHGLTEAYMELINWAKGRKINTEGDLTKFGMSIDNIEATPSSLFRYDFAIKVKNRYPTEGLIEFDTIPKALYATIHVIGSLEKVTQAWHFLYKEWLPNSGYLPVYYPAIEEFIEGPEHTGWKNFNLKCRIPVTKLPY